MTPDTRRDLILCGGDPTPDDLRAVNRFHAFLTDEARVKTGELTRSLFLARWADYANGTTTGPRHGPWPEEIDT